MGACLSHSTGYYFTEHYNILIMITSDNIITKESMFNC